MLWKRVVTWWLTALFMVSTVPAGDMTATETDLGFGDSALIAAAVSALTPTPEATATPSPTPEPTATPRPMAEDITMDCALNGYTGAMDLRDGAYKSYWSSTMQNGVHSLTITAPAGKTIGGVLIRWKSWPLAVAAQVMKNGRWTAVSVCEADFMAQYIEIPGGQEEIRIVSRDDNGRTKLEISEITVLTPGELPADIPVFRKAPEKVDMLLIATHPDDEVLWFGGLLATYAGERRKDVLVACGAHNNYYRRLELCDCLWAMGVDIYPHFMRYSDVTYADPMQILDAWGGRNKVRGDLVALYRQYRPDVLVLQAVGGESGHPAHRTLSQAAREAVELAASPTEFPQSAEAYGAWDVPKVYVHLWEENRIRMDWHVPLERFGGLTGMEVAEIGFDKHISQRDKEKYSIHDGGDTDCSLFGLFHTTVGPDQEKNDLFENIPVRGE